MKPFEVCRADQLLVGDRALEPWSGVEAEVRKVQPCKEDPPGVFVEFGPPANCTTLLKLDRLMRRRERES